MISNNDALTVLWQPPQDIHQSGLYDNTMHKFDHLPFGQLAVKKIAKKKVPSDWNYCSMRMKI